MLLGILKMIIFLLCILKLGLKLLSMSVCKVAPRADIRECAQFFHLPPPALLSAYVDTKLPG